MERRLSRFAVPQSCQAHVPAGASCHHGARPRPTARAAKPVACPRRWLWRLILAIAGIVAIAAISAPPSLARGTSGERRADVEVELDIFSGRPNPRWPMRADQVPVLATLVDTAPRVAPAEPPGLGYRGFVIHQITDNPAVPPTMRVYGGTITATIAGDQVSMADEQDLEQLLLSDAHLMGYGPLVATVSRQSSDDPRHPDDIRPSLPHPQPIAAPSCAAVALKSSTWRPSGRSETTGAVNPRATARRLGRGGARRRRPRRPAHFRTTSTPPGCAARRSQECRRPPRGCRPGPQPR